MENYRVKTRFIPFIIILIGLSACAQGIPVTDTPPTSTGIEGYVFIGPTCPGPERIGATKCQDQPYQANISILDSNKDKIIQFRTDPMGYFKVFLKSDTYILQPEPGKPLPTAEEQSVVVTDGQFTRVTILYDSGIR
jgi:hypothetical protein